MVWDFQFVRHLIAHWNPGVWIYKSGAFSCRPHKTKGTGNYSEDWIPLPEKLKWNKELSGWFHRLWWISRPDSNSLCRCWFETEKTKQRVVLWKLFFSNALSSWAYHQFKKYWNSHCFCKKKYEDIISHYGSKTCVI